VARVRAMRLMGFDHAFGELAHVDLVVGFIDYFGADKGLDGVFEGDDSCGASELIGDEEEVFASVDELEEDFGEGCRFGHDVEGAGEVAELGLIVSFAVGGVEFLPVDDADLVVEGGFDDGDAGEL